jgi:hypothetical protein
MAIHPSRRNPMPMSNRELADHCDFCRAAAAYINRDCPAYESGALHSMMLMHRKNDTERNEFYGRYLSYLYGSPGKFTTP